MVQGIGVDIVKLERIEAVHRRFGDRFARKVLSAEELSGGPVTHHSLQNVLQPKRLLQRPWEPALEAASLCRLSPSLKTR